MHPGLIEQWAAGNDPIERYVARLAGEGVSADTLAGIDARVQREIDEATDLAEASDTPEPLDALRGIYADPPEERPLWYREGRRAVVETSERPLSRRTFDAPAKASD